MAATFFYKLITNMSCYNQWHLLLHLNGKTTGSKCFAGAIGSELQKSETTSNSLSFLQYYLK